MPPTVERGGKTRGEVRRKGAARRLPGGLPRRVPVTAPNFPAVCCHNPPMSSRPSLAQVAALSGVSVKTASRALSGEGYVAVETKARVQSAADELGYRLN